MHKFTAYLFFGLVGLAGLFFIFAPLVPKLTFLTTGQLASVFFVESSKPEVLKQVFAEVPKTAKKIRILVVPGHDGEYWGTQFNDLKEGDMTLALGKDLAAVLATDPNFQVILARDDVGYTTVLSNYFSDQKDHIISFAEEKKKIMADLMATGEVSKETGVFHNTAPSPVIVRLYGINKWANENNIDLVVHVHFNDYPRRKTKTPGTYSGFSIYVPEEQYSNARASKAVADAVSAQLQTYYPESNMPKEEEGVVEDQDLIAIGAFNTLDPAALLVEYGYIYEPQFSNGTIRAKIIHDLAFQTYVGIRNFFTSTAPTPAGSFSTSFLPHRWDGPLTAGVKNDPAVLSLQAALVLEGVYPPEGFDPHDCPLAGTYGKCTWQSLVAFQKKYNLKDTPGTFGKETREKMNEKYGR